MKRILLLLALSLSPAVAAPPDLECLSDLSFNDAFTKQVDIRRDAPVVILIGAIDDPDPSATWVLWNEPSVVEFIQDRELIVTYLDEDTADQPYFELFQPETRPMLIYRDIQGEQHRLHLDQFPTQADALVDWLRNPERKQDEYRARELALYERIVLDPNNVGARLELIDLRTQILGRSYSTFSLLPWLFIENQSWYLYEFMMSRSTITEDEFRRTVFVEIMIARNSMDLFKDGFSRFQNTQFSSWIDRLDLDRTGVRSGPVSHSERLEWQWVKMLKPYFEECKQPSATDRDKFILLALTAEGDDWQALIDQYAGQED